MTAPKPIRGGSRSGIPVRATILDVARQAGVSLGTVSYVISGRRRVSDERRARVMAAIEALSYVPNSMAQALRSGQSRLIGICLPNTTTALFGQLFQYLEGIASAQGYEVVQVISHSDSAVEQRRLAALFAHRLGGLLIAPASDGLASGPLVAQADVPTVVLDRAVTWPHCDEVVVDNAAAAETVVDGLAALGHRRILFIASYPDLSTTRQRIEGMRRVVTRVGDGLAVEVFESGTDPLAFAARLAARLGAPDCPTALIASNTRIGMWTVRSLRELELSWPGDLSLVLFEHPDWADIVQPPVTVVDMPAEAMAQSAWRLLLARMADREAPTHREELQASVVMTGSVARRP